MPDHDLFLNQEGFVPKSQTVTIQLPRCHNHVFSLVTMMTKLWYVLRVVSEGRNKQPKWLFRLEDLLGCV